MRHCHKNKIVTLLYHSVTWEQQKIFDANKYEGQGIVLQPFYGDQSPLAVVHESTIVKRLDAYHIKSISIAHYG